MPSSDKAMKKQKKAKAKKAMKAMKTMKAKAMKTMKSIQTMKSRKGIAKEELSIEVEAAMLNNVPLGMLKYSSDSDEPIVSETYEESQQVNAYEPDQDWSIIAAQP